MSKLLGIDFGTSYSMAAVIKCGIPIPVPDRSGNSLRIPSVVHIRKNGECLVGEDAKGKAFFQPGATIGALKRRMLADDSVCLRNTHYHYDYLISKIFRALKESAERFVGTAIPEAVISLPTGMKKHHYDVVVEAGKMAGFQKVYTIKDSEAILTAYFNRSNAVQNVLICDLGGGTTSITIGKIRDGMMPEILNNRSIFLGGIDFDARIADWMAKKFNALHGARSRSGQKARQQLLKSAEDAKITLSDEQSAKIFAPSAIKKHCRTKSSTIFSRDIHDELFKDYWTQLDELLSVGKYTGFEKVILTGGMAKIPRVRDHINKILGNVHCCEMYADEAVACGAALYGESHWSENKKSEGHIYCEKSIALDGENASSVKGNKQSENIKPKLYEMRETPYKILVTATMSAGKSTFINALAGNYVSRAENLACTDQIISVISTPEDDTATPKTHLTENDPASVSVYYDGLLSGARLIVKDSPGVNSSMNWKHRAITEREICAKEYDLLVCLMNATQLATNDDSLYLDFVAEQVKDKPILFILNKIDCLKPDEENVSEVLRRAEDYVRGKGFVNPVLCPLAAKIGFMAKKARNSEFDRQLRFCSYNLEQLDLPSYYQAKLPQIRIGGDIPSESTEGLLKNSGMKYVESIILEYYTGGINDGKSLRQV